MVSISLSLSLSSLLSLNYISLSINSTFSFPQVIALCYACFLKIDTPSTHDSEDDDVEAPLLGDG
jgi:hypothetical protein